MRLYRVILPVANIDDAARFFSALFELPGERVSTGRHYFNLEGTVLAIYDPVADGDDVSPKWKPHFNQYLYISVSDLASVFTKVKSWKKVTNVTEIEQMPWGERLFYFNDPWGNPLCFVDQSTVFTGWS